MHYAPTRLAATSLPALLFATFLLVGSLPASARPEFPPVVHQAYQLKPGGAVATAVDQCTFCHVPGGPPGLNPYGLDVRTALRRANARALTPAILHSIDNLDSNGDGIRNGLEIAGDKLPGAVKPGSAAARAATTAGSPQPGAEPGLFSVQRLLVPRSAQHPAVIHFAIALIVISFVFDVLGLLGIGGRSLLLHAAAYYNLIAAAAGALLAEATGLLAWRILFDGEALRGLIFYHLVLSSTATALMLVLLFIRSRHAEAGRPGRVYMILAAFTVLIIFLTGHLGGGLAGTA